VALPTSLPIELAQGWIFSTSLVFARRSLSLHQAIPFCSAMFSPDINGHCDCCSKSTQGIFSFFLCFMRSSSGDRLIFRGLHSVV